METTPGTEFCYDPADMELYGLWTRLPYTNTYIHGQMMLKMCIVDDIYDEEMADRKSVV